MVTIHAPAGGATSIGVGENKRQITLRLDSDVLDFFKNTGSRYQSRINAVLREYVNAHRSVA